MNIDDLDRLLEQAPDNLKAPRNFFTAGLKNPHRFLYGLGASREVGAEAAQLVEDRRALLVSDAILAELGLVARIGRSLESAGFTVESFVEVEPEPHIETIDKLNGIASTFKPSVIVGLGGGSAMDVAKIVALASGCAISPLACFREPERLKAGTPLPLILIPTTAGTGSEVSIFAVATAGKEKLALANERVLPEIAILDPLLTVSMPKSVTAATGIDALSHAVEAMMHVATTPLCDALSTGAISLVARALPRAYEDGRDLAARYDMMVASAVGMMSFNHTGGLWAHSVSYVLGAYKPTPHGLGCALGLPYLLAFNEPAIPDVTRRIAALLGAEHGGSAARAVADLMRRVGMPVTLAEYGIPDDRIEPMADEMVRLYPRPNNARPMSPDQARAYWSAMHSGAGVIDEAA